MINEKVSVWEKKSEKYLVALSLVFIAILILPYAKPISESTKNLLQAIDYAIWAIFFFDYMYKLIIADFKKIFIKTHILELLIIAIPALRPLRLLRVFPVVGFFLSYSQKNLAGKLLQYVTLVAIFISIPAAIYTFQIERSAPGSNIKTFGDAIWWTITTVFTVGYGDRYPVTTLGRVMATLVMLAGISLVGVITASIASWFVRSDEQESEKIELQTILKELNEIKSRIERLEK